MVPEQYDMLGNKIDTTPEPSVDYGEMSDEGKALLTASPPGWWNRTGGHINPLALARGLAQAVSRKGGAIYAHSPVMSIARRGACDRGAGTLPRRT